MSAGLEIRFFGHACLKVGSERACLFDPWFSRSGAFFSSWFQFPENYPFLNQALESVTDICVSHNHADHFDPQTLTLALERNPTLSLHIPNYATAWFKRKVDRELPRFRDRIREHSAFEPFDLAGGGQVYFVPEESPAHFDAAIVFCREGEALVNLNDARLSTRQLAAIKSSAKKIRVLALQGSGASEYPINYSYSASEMRRASVEKRRSKWEACLRAIDALNPERILFFAGPPVFLGAGLGAFNEKSEFSVFPDQLDILEHYAIHRPDVAGRCYFALPGDELTEARLWSNCQQELHEGSERMLPYTNRERYLKDYADRRRDVLSFQRGELPEENNLLDHFAALPFLSEYISATIPGKICFEIEGERESKSLVVDFRKKATYFGTAEDALYRIAVPASLLSDVLAGKATWDDIFLSLRARFDESSDRFVPHLKTLLRCYDSEVLSQLESYECVSLSDQGDKEMMVVEVGGRTFKIQRYCPHAGADLATNGRLNPDGTITCLAHRFCFDLKTGHCLNATGFHLKVEECDLETVSPSSPSFHPSSSR